jgi:hypothetical protein
MIAQTDGPDKYGRRRESMSLAKRNWNYVCRIAG